METANNLKQKGKLFADLIKKPSNNSKNIFKIEQKLLKLIISNKIFIFRLFLLRQMTKLTNLINFLQNI